MLSFLYLLFLVSYMQSYYVWYSVSIVIYLPPVRVRKNKKTPTCRGATGRGLYVKGLFIPLETLLLRQQGFPLHFRGL
jgi:hypothetical protein